MSDRLAYRLDTTGYYMEHTSYRDGVTPRRNPDEVYLPRNINTVDKARKHFDAFVSDLKATAPSNVTHILRLVHSNGKEKKVLTETVTLRGRGKPISPLPPRSKRSPDKRY